MLHFERTRDMDLVRAIITRPEIYPHVTDDFSASAEEYQPFEHEGLWHVLAYGDGELLGLFAFFVNGISAQLHTCLLRSAWGTWTQIAGTAVLDWMFANSPVLRITTNVPAYNRVALKAALVCGMKQFGVNEASYMKHGKLHDQILLGISKRGN